MPSGQWQLAENYTDPDGRYTIHTHGIRIGLNPIPDRVSMHYDGATSLSVSALAEYVLNDPGYDGRDIFLAACYTGFGGENSFAQQLQDLINSSSDYFNVTVYAPTGELGYYGGYGVDTEIKPVDDCIIVPEKLNTIES